MLSGGAGVVRERTAACNSVHFTDRPARNTQEPLPSGKSCWICSFWISFNKDSHFGISIGVVAAVGVAFVVLVLFALVSCGVGGCYECCLLVLAVVIVAKGWVCVCCGYCVVGCYGCCSYCAVFCAVVIVVVWLLWLLCCSGFLWLLCWLLWCCCCGYCAGYCGVFVVIVLS